MVVLGTLSRLLELVRRQLGASDARFELGGNPPDSPDILWHSLDDQWRLVVIFDAPLKDSDELQAKLTSLVDSFALTSEPVKPPFATVPPSDLLERRLDETVAALADLAQARAALVIDTKSPIIWASSCRRVGEEVEDLVELARCCAEAQALGLELVPAAEQNEEELARAFEAHSLGAVAARRLAGELVGADAEEWRTRRVLVSAVNEVRSGHANEPRSQGGVGNDTWVCRAFASSYLLVTTFTGEVPRLALERALHHALPRVEALLLRLPPLDPAPAGARRALRLVPNP